ncbi:MAG: hypothetical protein EA418_11795 [Wenzhouxiangellaceae bacterium]|nr:MAG: hypothetical protein EA418_11795 [Wenzhouxiangellaceae bacterium]
MSTARKRQAWSICLAAIWLLAASLAWADVLQGEAGYQSNWYRVASGGSTFSTGSGYEVVGTIGQSETSSPSLIAGGDYAIRSGFWAAAVQPLPDELFRDRFESPDRVQTVDRRQGPID